MKKQNDPRRLPIDKGWDKMQVLLDENMPVEDPKDKALWRSSILFALVFLLAGGSVYSPNDRDNVAKTLSYGPIKTPQPPFLRSLPSTALPQTEKWVHSNERTPVHIPYSNRTPRTDRDRLLKAPIPNTQSSRYTPAARTQRVVNPPRPIAPTKGVRIISSAIASTALWPKPSPDKSPPHLDPAIALPSTVSQIASLETTTLGIRTHNHLKHALPASSIPPEKSLAIYVGYTGITHRGGVAGLHWTQRITPRWRWTAGTEIAALYSQKRLDRRRVYHEQFEWLTNPDDASNPNQFNGHTKPLIPYKRARVHTYNTLVGSFQGGLTYRWLSKTTLIMAGRLEGYQSRGNYKEHFQPENASSLGNTVTSGSVHPSPYTVLFPKLETIDRGILAGAQIGISHALTEKLHFSIQSKWVKPLLPLKVENSAIPKRSASYFYPSSRFLPDVYNFSLGLSCRLD